MIYKLFISSFRNLFRKKVRSILTALGIGIGVASVIIINSIGSVGTTAVNTELDSLGMGGLTISTDSTENYPLTEEQLDIVKNTPGVAGATPVSVTATDVYDSCGKSESSLIWGIDSNAKNIVSLDLMYGRFLNNNDIVNNASKCMVDQTFAKKMYGKDNVVGRTITASCGQSTEDLTIIGVIKTGSGLLQNAMGTYLPNFIYIPYTTSAQLTGSNSFSQIITRISTDADINSVSDNISRRLDFSVGASDSYKINNLVKQKEILTNILEIVTIILSCVGAVSLVVASLSIMTVMLVSVSERKREIGIKKAIGATKAIIMREFVIEALVLSVIGCFAGVIIGSAISFILEKTLNCNIIIPFTTIFYTCLFSSVSGIIFSAYPAYKASKLKPAESLRAL